MYGNGLKSYVVLLVYIIHQIVAQKSENYLESFGCIDNH